MRQPLFFGEAWVRYLIPRQREDPDIEKPSDDDPVPLLPGEEHGPRVERPPDKDQEDPLPIGEPNPAEPTRLF